ncbi:PilW family protein [Thiohalorhabdus sp. Cl-TMA]|uniref:PilW family protein n=1 Tax=Thiohalorhabdus methylotrophus TaxID=3242694 RepID=A0ABV4TX67_9GAMM
MSVYRVVAVSARSTSRGFSLVELLVAMVVVGIFLGAVFGTFINFLTESGEQATLSKRSFDTRLGLDQVRSDLQKIGFGVADPQLPATVTGDNQSLTFRSTAVHSQGAMAGIQGVLYESGGTLTANDWLGSNIAGTQPGVVMTPDRELLQTVQLQNVTVSPRNLFFPAPNATTSGYYYERTYYLGGGGTGAGCADSNVSNLLFQDASPNGMGPVSVIDCVLDLRFQYGFELSSGGIGFSSDPSSPPAGPEDDFPDVIKVGMIIQVGHGYRNQTPTPGPLNYDDPDLQLGTPISLSSAQQRYRWQIVEWSAPLENMP